MATRARMLVWFGIALGVIALLLSSLVCRYRGDEKVRDRSGADAARESAPPARLTGSSPGEPEGNLGPASDEETPPSAHLLQVAVRDLFDEAVVPGLAFGATSGDGDSDPPPLITNAEGVVHIRPESVPHLKEASPPWRVAWSTPAEVRSSGKLWVYRVVELDIQVRASSKAQRLLDPTTARIDLVPGGPPDVAMDVVVPDPWNLRWMRRHNVAKLERAVRPDTRGVAQAAVPRVRWLGLRGTAPGWVTRRVEIPFANFAGVEPIPVLLVLEPAPQIAVKVCDKDGRPLRGARVRAHTFRTLAFEDVDVQRMQVPGTAFVVRGKPDGTAIVTYSIEGRTTEDGHFTFDAVASGEILVTTHASGHSPDRSRLVHVGQDIEVDIALEAAGSAPVAVVWDSIPLAWGGLALTDVTDVDRQTLVTTELDEQGRAPGEWLIVGRTYWLVVGYRGQRPSGVPTDVMLQGCLVWDGRETVDLSRLAKSFRELRERGR